MLNPDRSLTAIENQPAQGSPLRVELVGEEAACAEVRAVLTAVSDPPVEIVKPAANLPQRTDMASADIAMVIVDPTTLSLLQAYARQLPRPTVLAALHERSAAAMRRALQAGADELLFLPLELGAITRALLKVNETRRQLDHPSGGTVCSVVSNTGGVGVTSLAANLGLALRDKLDKRVVLVDLHLQSGDLPIYLNLDVHSSIMALCGGDRQLDSSRLETALTKHRSGLYVLAAPSGIEESEVLPEETIVSAIGLMRELFDFVVVDCGSYVDGKTVAVWERSDYLFYVLEQTVRAVRGAGRFLDLYGRLGITQVEPRFILNKFVPGHPIGEEQITQTLGGPIYTKIPSDKAALDLVELRGEDLWQVAASSALTRAIEELVGKMTGTDQGRSEKRERLFSRLLGGVATRV